MRKNLLLTMCLAACSSFVLAQDGTNLDNYFDGNSEFTVIGTSSHSLNTPVDLDFHPAADRAYELWVLNRRSFTSGQGATTVIFHNAGRIDQSNEFRRDGVAGHFMAGATAIDFSPENENWGSSTGVLNANFQGTTFTGPSLWSSDLDIYGIIGNPASAQFNGSHLDMLHQSPWGMGIAHEVDNVFWVFDGFNGHVVRYDFADDHGPGQDFHGDGRIRRYPDVAVEKVDAIPSHMVLDKENNMLYICDTGNDRVLRLDITSGTEGSALTSFTEQLAEFREMDNPDWDVILTGLDDPCGIEVVGDRLIISENGSNDIIFYDISGDMPVEIDRLNYGADASSVMGLTVGPDGLIWFVDNTRREVVRIDNPNVVIFPTGVDNKATQTADFKVYPNPSNGLFYLESSNVNTDEMFQVRVYDLLGKQVHQQQNQFNGNQIMDLNNLKAGIYILSISNETESVTKKIIVE